MKRIDILKGSLAKKEAAFDAAIDAHFADVKSANGQPLNDKRNGHVTLNRWEKQNDALRSKQSGIERTKAAIEREEWKIERTEAAVASFPKPIQDRIASGVLTVWRKHPNHLFVSGVDKARIRFDQRGLFACHFRNLSDEQLALFKSVYFPLKREMEAQNDKS